jgi:tripartite ATP-independent transporter DctP family solute receptor
MIKSLWVSCVLGALVLGPAVASAADAHQYSLGYDQPHATGYGIAADIFAKKLEELSKGAMLIDQFPGAQLGQEPQMLQSIRTGDIDFLISSTANASTVAPESGVFSLHFIFRGEDHLQRVLHDQAVIAAMKQMVADSTKGAQVLTLMTLGLRDMYSKREFHKVEDMKGVKVRVQATKTEDAHFPAYGAQTVHMPFGDVYTALQTGLVEAAENGVNVYLTNKHYEVAPIMSMTEHEANNSFFWVSDKVWNGLSAEQQGWVQTSADEVNKLQIGKAIELDHQSLERLQKIGVKIVKDVDKSGFIKAAEPIQDQLAKELGPHAVKVLQLVRGVTGS